MSMKDVTFGSGLVEAAGQYVRNRDRLTAEQWVRLESFAVGLRDRSIAEACASIFYALHEGAEIEDEETNKP